MSVPVHTRMCVPMSAGVCRVQMPALELELQGLGAWVLGIQLRSCVEQSLNH